MLPVSILQQQQAFQQAGFLENPSFHKMKREAHKNSCQSPWSWSNRKKRSLEQAAEDPMQSRITDYWNVMDTIEQLQYKNDKLLKN